MKKLLLLIVFCTIFGSFAQAQLPDGSTAPDFTVVDINGGSHHLYDLLNAGKTVYLDMFATWCAPCWSYHNSGALEGVWAEYGPPGTNEAYVMAIEADPGTTVPCITNTSGCSGGTQSNWAAGTPYPICDAASVGDLYAITYYPTIYMVYPNHLVYECGQIPLCRAPVRVSNYKARAARAATIPTSGRH